MDDKRNSSAREEMFYSYALRMTKRRIRLMDLASSLLLMAAAGMVMLLVAVILDHASSDGLSASARRIFRWLFILVEAALLGWLIVRPLLRRLNDLYVARLIERANPSFRNDLTAALELQGQGEEDERLAAIRRRASSEVASGDTASAVSTRGLRISAILFGLAVGCMVGYGLFSPQSLLASIRRTFGDDSVPPPSRTRLVSLTPDDGALTVVGADVEFTAVLRNAGPDVRLRISRDGGSTFLDDDQRRMDPAESVDDAQAFRASWTAPGSGTVVFQVVSGDLRSSLRRMEILPMPAIEDVNVQYHWPDYIGRGISVSSGGHIEAPPGTHVQLTALANQPVARASLVFENTGQSAMMDTRGRELSAMLRVRDSDRYRIRFTTEEGSVGESILYSIDARPDASPQVRLVAPADDMEIAPGMSIPLAGQATDDYGLAAVDLVFRRGMEKRVISLSRHDRPGAPSKPVDRSLPIDELADPGETIILHLEARDFHAGQNHGEGQVGRSRAVAITVRQSDPEEQQRRQVEQQDEQHAEQQARESSSEQTTETEPQTSQSPAKGEGDATPSKRDIENLLDASPEDADRLETLQQRLGEDSTHAEPSPAEDQEHPESSPAADAPATSGEHAESEAQQPSAQQGDETAGETPAPDGDTPTPDAPTPAPQDGPQEDPLSDSPKPSDSESTGSAGDQPVVPGPQSGPDPEGRDNAPPAEQPSPAGPEESVSTEPPLPDQPQGPPATPSGPSEAPDEPGQPAELPEPGAVQPEDGQPPEMQQPDMQDPGRQQPGSPSESGAPGTAPSGPGVSPGDASEGSAGEGDSSASSDRGRESAGNDNPQPDTAHAEQSSGGGPASGIHENTPGAANPVQADPQANDADVPDPMAPAGESRPLESLGRALDEAQRQIRDNEVPPELLQDLGMTPPQYKTFVETYVRRYRELAMQRTDAQETVRGDVREVGEEGRQRGEGVDVGNRSGSVEMETQQDADARTSNPQDVSPEYREALEAYLRSVSEAASQGS